jgi:hypothetical protein
MPVSTTTLHTLSNITSADTAKGLQFPDSSKGGTTAQCRRLNAGMQFIGSRRQIIGNPEEAFACASLSHDVTILNC